MAELIKIRGCDRPERRADVIFVHGLNGNPGKYWSHNDEPTKFWPAWMGEDLPDVGVWSLGYENAALKPRWFSLIGKFLQRGFAMPLEDRADNVLLALESHQIGERPLMFITHSMGGLLIKEVLRTANDSSDPRRKALVQRTRGVCFIATPHIGSDLAKWASYSKLLLGTSVAMDELRSHQAHLRKMNRWYRDFVASEVRGIKTLSFFETKPTPGIGRLVVEQGDADPGVPNAGPYPLDEDHASICKPRSKEDLIHVRVTEFIRRDCLQLDERPSPGGRSFSPEKPDIPSTPHPPDREGTGPDTTQAKERTPPKPEENPPGPGAANGPSGEAVSTVTDPMMGGDSSDESRWETYRLRIRKRLEEILDEVRGNPVLMRLFQELGTDGASSDEDSVKKRIVDDLMKAHDRFAIPRIIRLHGELCSEGSDREAGKISDCVDLILPLYFSRKALGKAWRQLQVQKVVILEGTVATETGAEVVISLYDGRGPCFLPNERAIPRGEGSIPFELPAIGDPSLDTQVLAILEDLAKGSGVDRIDHARAGSPRKNVAARVEQLSQDLRGWLDPLKSLTGRTPYCALAMPETPTDRDNLMNVLKKVRELVPPLVFIELFPESETREEEVFFIRCLNTRLKSQQRLKPK
ncbi:MAG: hypothetical protein ACLQGP_07115 [Isosphaeraceae bacterium]